MQPAPSIDAFVAAPLGRYYRASRWLFWCHGPSLAGTAHWGRPEVADLREFLRGLAFARAPGLRPPFDFLTDAQRTQSPSVEGYALVAEHIGTRIRQLIPLIRRQAVVHSGGLAGAAVAGFNALFAWQHRWKLFSEPRPAFAWLGAAAVHDEVASLIGESASLPPLTAGLRALWDRHGLELGFEDAARRLGCSERSLQRQLAAESTSFRRELARARVRRAVELLADGEAKLEAIARQVGCSSLPAFSRLYRRLTGESPSQTRERLKPGPNI